MSLPLVNPLVKTVKVKKWGIFYKVSIDLHTNDQSRYRRWCNMSHLSRAKRQREGDILNAHLLLNIVDAYMVETMDFRGLSISLMDFDRLPPQSENKRVGGLKT